MALRLFGRQRGDISRQRYISNEGSRKSMQRDFQKTSRREFIVLAGLASLSVRLRAQISPHESRFHGPILWLVQQGGAKVYIFGFAEAQDRSWLTPKIQRAFDESQEIWFETPSANVGITESERKKQREEDDRLIQELGHDDTKTLFDILGPQLGDRTLKMANELGVPRDQIEHLRPWLAYYVINSAFVRTVHLEVSEYPDKVLGNLAAAEKKIIRTEYATPADTTRWFASLSDEAQREHMEDLLDFIDDQKAGRNRAEYTWITGHEDLRTLDRMREKRPAMYEAFQVARNKQWADRVAGFLSTDKTYFVAIGRNHTVGPDSIPHCLERIGFGARQT